MIRVLILTGNPGMIHDWRATTPIIREALEESGFEVRVVEEPAILETRTLMTYDILLSNYNEERYRWPRKQENGLLNFVKGGKGFVVIHAADNAFPKWPEYERLIGGAWREETYHLKYQVFRVKIADKNHVITKDMEDFEICDELYCNLKMQSNIHLLAYSTSPFFSKEEYLSGATPSHEGKNQPVAWTLDYGKGRVFQVTLGHDVQSMKNSNFIRLLINGTKWASGS